MVEEAQGLRARVLADLSKRRKVLHAQIEQLRAGRERLSETVQDVRRSVDTIADELFAAEDNARLAAEAAGRQAAARPDEGTPEELAALLLAEEEAAPAVEDSSEDGSASEAATDHPEGPEPEQEDTTVESSDESTGDRRARLRAAPGCPTNRRSRPCSPRSAPPNTSPRRAPPEPEPDDGSEGRTDQAEGAPRVVASEPREEPADEDAGRAT